jgi:hypothetical protein
MRLLLDGAYSPITDGGAFIDATAEECADWWVEWSPQFTPHRKIAVTGSLPEVLECLLPLQIHQKRVLFIPAESGWTAGFEDGWRGTDPGFVWVAAQQLGTRTVWFDYVADTMQEDGRGRYGASIFRYYEPDPTGEYAREARSINAIHDGDRWSFDLIGEPLPFEDESLYRKRAIRDRFPPEALRAYLEHLGIRAFEEDFYRPEDGAFVVERLWEWETDETVSLEEARANR